MGHSIDSNMKYVFVVHVGVSMSKSAAGVACGLILETQPGSESIQRHQIISDLSVSKMIVVIY